MDDATLREGIQRTWLYVYGVGTPSNRVSEAFWGAFGRQCSWLRQQAKPRIMLVCSDCAYDCSLWEFNPNVQRGYPKALPRGEDASTLALQTRHGMARRCGEVFVDLGAGLPPMSPSWLVWQNCFLGRDTSCLPLENWLAHCRTSNAGGPHAYMHTGIQRSVLTRSTLLSEIADFCKPMMQALAHTQNNRERRG